MVWIRAGTTIRAAVIENSFRYENSTELWFTIPICNVHR